MGGLLAGQPDRAFQHDLAKKIAAQYPVGLDTVVKVHSLFGGTIRATLRVYAQDHRSPMLAVVLDCSPLSRHPLSFQRREVVASAKWKQRFGEPSYRKVISSPPERWLTVAAASSAGGSAAGEDAFTDWLALADPFALNSSIRLTSFSGSSGCQVVDSLDARIRTPRGPTADT